MLIYDTITKKFEGKNKFDLSVPCEWAHYKLHKNAGLIEIGKTLLIYGIHVNKFI